MIDRIRREPALVAGIVQALLAALVAFGLPISSGQTAALLALTAAVLAVFVRERVTPVVVLEEGSDPEGDVSGG